LANFGRRDELTGPAAISAVVEQIIAAESSGDPNLKDSHSSAIGLGQFLNDTWLDLIRQYRPNLTKGRSKSETLELRRDAKLTREITMRFVEQNAAILKHRGLPVTAGAIYLAHFAGPAGAVAILSASDNADKMWREDHLKSASPPDRLSSSPRAAIVGTLSRTCGNKRDAALLLSV
jgi:hypothetical protein